MYYLSLRSNHLDLNQKVTCIKRMIMQAVKQIVIMPCGNLGMTMGLNSSLVAVGVWGSFILKQVSG
jgi:hypothetical protein